MPAAHLIPPGRVRPLPVDDYALSKDGARLLIFTNSKRVWRQNTRGDYWVLDRATRELRKLGGDAPPSSLMHAKLAPVGPRVAYVRENNLYVEDLRDGRITPLTNSKSADEINGTFDWVYEEEFGLRDGFRWSPDGEIDRLLAAQHRGDARVSAGQYDRFALSADHAGQVSQGRRAERGMPDRGRAGRRGADVLAAAEGDPRENYVAYMEWVDSNELILQQFNRLQDTVGSSCIERARTARRRRRDADPRRARRRLDRPPG